jgi:methylmalonyl-CoA/ethylmalonyl-CoA epimerase
MVDGPGFVAAGPVSLWGWLRRDYRAGMLPYNLDHVAIAVRDLEAAVKDYERLYGAAPLHRERVESQGVEEVMMAVGGSFVQLLAPIGPDTPVGRFITKRGEGLHHLAFAVPDIEAALSHLAASGAELIDPEPRPGSRGTRIAFVHPRTFGGTLIELVELPS